MRTFNNQRTRCRRRDCDIRLKLAGAPETWTTVGLPSRSPRRSASAGLHPRHVGCDVAVFFAAPQRREKNGRGDRIRTYDLLVPNQALYQAKLHPDTGPHAWLKPQLVNVPLGLFARLWLILAGFASGGGVAGIVNNLCLPRLGILLLLPPQLLNSWTPFLAKTTACSPSVASSSA